MCALVNRILPLFLKWHTNITFCNILVKFVSQNNPKLFTLIFVVVGGGGVHRFWVLGSKEVLLKKIPLHFYGKL